MAYRHIIAPMLDGQPPYGFKVDGSLNVVSNNLTMGLREVAGTDPQSDSFSLGHPRDMASRCLTMAGFESTHCRVSR